MNSRDVPREHLDRIEEACKAADHIFLCAVDRTAHMLELSATDQHTPKHIRSICEKYPHIVAGFMQAIAVIYAQQEQSEEW
jgi:hypothetical protein